MLFSNLILTVILVLGYAKSQDQPTITLKTGEVRGHYKHSSGGRTFAAFEGIPYAKPPVGELRFAESQPAEPWDGVWDATVVHTCIQLTWITNAVMGNEDCLYINVYVPREQPIPNENLDVVVNIHGGAFMIGNPELGGPEFLMDRDVVYVNLNYRLGVLGFISTEDGVVPGNNGLKDQVLALKWIQENIAKFGGNPSSVTIVGVSAGAGSVHLHYLSPLSKGLFHRGISHSGVATTPWGSQEAPLRRTRAIADTVGCNHTSTEELVECLRQRSAYQLVSNIGKLQNVLPGFPLVLFGPVIEDESSTAFLTDHPLKLLEAGKVRDLPWITTVCTEEGILGLLMVLGALDQVENKWTELAPGLLDYDVSVPESDKDSISQRVKEHYFGTQKISSETIPQIIKLFGDRYFARDFKRASKLQSKVNKSPVYAYVYGYKSLSSSENVKKAYKIDKDFGVSHGEDGQLLYTIKLDGLSMSPQNLTEADRAIKELFVDMVISFVKTDKPKMKGVSWEPVSDSKDFGYLLVKGAEDVRMVQDNAIGSDDFWKSLSLNEDAKFRSPKTL